MASVISMSLLLQGKQSWYRFRRDPCGQATKVPGSTEEDELVFVPIVMASSAKMKPYKAKQKKKKSCVMNT